MVQHLGEIMDETLAAAETLAARRAAYPEIARIEVSELIAAGRRGAVFRGVRDGAEVALRLMHVPDPATAIARMAEALDELAGHMTDGPFRVPRLVTALPEAGAIVTQFIPGERLRDRLATAPEGERDEQLRAAGQWFAQIVAPPARHRVGAFQPQFWTERRAAALDRAAAEDRPDGDPQMARALARRLEEMTPPLRGARVTQGRGHGDFHAGKLIRTSEALYGVDIEGAHFLPMAKELARFLVHLELQTPRDGPGWHGVSAADCGALLAEVPLAPHDEDAILPFMIGVELGDACAGPPREGADDARLMRAIGAYLAATAP